VDASGGGAIDFAAEVVEKGGGMIGGVDEVGNITGVGALDVAKNDASAVIGYEAIEVGGWSGPSEVKYGGTCFEARASDLEVVSFNGKEDALLGEGFENGEEGTDLLGGVDAGGVGKGGFGAEVDEVGAFGAEAAGAVEGVLGGGDDTFTVPGVGAEVDDAHEVGAMGGRKGLATDFELSDLGSEGGGVFLGEAGEGFEGEHEEISVAKKRARGESGDGRQGGEESRVSGWLTDY
jgi:hypothetical protein